MGFQRINREHIKTHAGFWFELVFGATIWTFNKLSLNCCSLLDLLYFLLLFSVCRWFLWEMWFSFISLMVSIYVHYGKKKGPLKFKQVQVKLIIKFSWKLNILVINKSLLHLNNYACQLYWNHTNVFLTKMYTQTNSARSTDGCSWLL